MAAELPCKGALNVNRVSSRGMQRPSAHQGDRGPRLLSEQRQSGTIVRHRSRPIFLSSRGSSKSRMLRETLAHERLVAIPPFPESSGLALSARPRGLPRSITDQELESNTSASGS